MRAENFRFRQAAFGDLHFEVIGELVRVAEEHPPLREVAGHGQRVQPDVVVMFGEIALRDLVALVERGLHTLVEPSLDAEIEEDDGEDRDQDGRHGGDAAEQQHQPHMQPCPGGAAPVLQHHAGDTADQHDDQHQQRREIGHHHADGGAGMHVQLDPPGEHREGGDAEGERDRGDQERREAPEQNVQDVA